MIIKTIMKYIKRNTKVIVTVILTTLLCNLSCQNKSKSAIQLRDSMINTLHKARTLYYETEVHSFDRDNDKTSTFKVWLKKPNYVRIEYMKKGILSGVLVGDGENFWVYWPAGRYRKISETDAEYEATKKNSFQKFRIKLGSHSIWHIVPKLGGGMMAFQPSYFHKCPFVIDETIDTMINHGVEKIGNDEFDVVEVSFMNHQRSHYYWLSKRNYLPCRVKDVVRIADSSVRVENWSNVMVNHKIPDSLFSWKPPNDYVELIKPPIEEGLLKTGTHAPDFSFKTLDGKKFRLSDQKGKVVLINFWRVGCPASRDELVWLEEIYQTYKDKGLVVVGFNMCDDEKYVRELLNGNKITYSNILDTSKEAQQVQFQQYQNESGSAVPLNYLIDRQGYVIHAWYGSGYYYKLIRNAMESQ